MLLEEIRMQVVKYAKKMLHARLTVGTSGNVSALDAESGHIAITPSGMDYDELTPEDICVIDMNGTVVDGTRRPSTERFLHITAYKRRPNAGAVLHTHSSYATTVAAMGRTIPVILAEVAAIAGGPIPIAPYTRFGTQQFGDVALDAMGGSPAVLLQNHGVVAVGPSLEKAFLIAVDVEEAAKIYLMSLMAGQEALRIPDSEIPILYEIYSTRYGQNPSKP